MRKPLMAGNWKMYKTPAETRAFFDVFRPLIAATEDEEFRPLIAATEDRDILICPPFTDLQAAVHCAEGTTIAIGGQNLHWGTEGAVTGEISGYMLRQLGCRYVLIGHSERRQYFGEGEPAVLRKTRAALEHGLIPIICVGERLEEREADRTEELLASQFDGGILPLTPDEFSHVVLAYEPIWAIGTGRTATPEIAAAAHHFLRQRTVGRFGAAAAASLRILYGGSVKPDNIKSLMAEEEIDGVLVGGASLDPQSFAAIVSY